MWLDGDKTNGRHPSIVCHTYFIWKYELHLNIKHKINDLKLISSLWDLISSLWDLTSSLWDLISSLWDLFCSLFCIYNLLDTDLDFTICLIYIIIVICECCLLWIMYCSRDPVSSTINAVKHQLYIIFKLQRLGMIKCGDAASKWSILVSNCDTSVFWIFVRRFSMFHHVW